MIAGILLDIGIGYNVECGINCSGQISFDETGVWIYATIQRSL